ncbi:MAG: hypothetical protein GX799_10825 [Crenarchaeota archaeon]|nr:hypothetical protein [Thermoproteota archaeon]
MNNDVAKNRSKSSMFQILLLHNDVNQDVSVQETEKVNFYIVKEHLHNGGSVFITSKDNQKIKYSTKAQNNYAKARKNIGFLFRQYVRSS